MKSDEKVKEPDECKCCFIEWNITTGEIKQLDKCCDNCIVKEERIKLGLPIYS